MASNLYQTLFLSQFLLLSFSHTSAAASPSALAFQMSQRDTATKPLDCTTDTSLDYYGFGVRLGVYFAWLSSYFANILLPSEIAGALDTNSIFLLALIASLLRGSGTRDIAKIDGLVIMQLCSGFLFSSLSIWGYRTSYYHKEGPKGIRHFGKFGTHCRLILSLAISLYGTWFWWKGLKDGLVTSPDPRCQHIYTWFFRVLPVSGGISKYYIIVSFGCAVYYGIMCVTAVVAALGKIFRVGWKGEMEFETGLNVRELDFLFNIFRVFNLFWIIFCGASIEVTLNENHILQALSMNGKIAYPSQLIPLIVGALSFLRVLWLIHEGWKEHIKKESKSGSKHLDAGGGALKKESLYQRFVSNIMKIKFVSAMIKPDAMPSQQRSGPCSAKRSRSWQLRYLVAFLPWLSTFEFWKHEDKQDSSADIEGTSPSQLMRHREDDKEVRAN